MPNSLKSQITKLRFKDKISINEYEALMSKLAGHDRELKAECVREFAEWLDSLPAVGMYDYHGNLVTATSLLEEYKGGAE